MDVTMASPPEEKVWLFRALFHGRDDVTHRLPCVLDDILAALSARPKGN